MKINIKVPESLNEITLEQYQKFDKLIKDNEPSYFVNQKTIEIFCGIDLKDVARIRIADVNEILEHLNNLLQQRTPLINTFKLGSTEFGFIPKLEDITAGEYIDIENYLSDVQTLHKAMAVLYRPTSNKVKNMYLIEEYENSDKYSEVMKYMPLGVALGSMVFFYTLLNDCVSGLMGFIHNEVEQSEQAKKVLEENGVGINQFMQQHKEMFSNLMPLPNFQLLN
jgi:hypothetical protein